MQFCGDCGSQLPSFKKITVTETIETPKEEFTTGSIFAGRYQIIEELGEGGMGKVYRVLDKKLKEEAALKLIRPDIAQDKRTVERFQNELKVARKISHRNVGRMYELLEEKGTHYITMEYIPGQDLKGLIKQSGRLAFPTVLSIAKQVCEGLREAHKLSVIHRDLKPSNIMIDKEGSVRILDFGIARSLQEKGLTGKGVIIGTPEYMSPEQVEAGEIDERSDIYSFGVVLYEMTTGKLPFEANSPYAVGVKHKSEIPQDPKILNPQLSDDFRKLMLKCLEKDKKDRYQNIDELLKDLEDIDAGIPSVVHVEPQRKPLTSKEIHVSFRLSKLIIPIICLALGVFLSRLLFWQSNPPVSPAVTRTKIDVQPAKQLGGFPTELRSGFGRPSRKALALSPDGRTLVYYALHESNTRLYRRSLDSWEGIPLEGTEGAIAPFFSPDGLWIGFWADDQFKKVPVNGDLPTTLCESNRHYGVSWGSNDKIIHSRSGVLCWFPDTGGEQETLISPDLAKVEFGFYAPHVLPGAKAVLYSVQKSDSYWENPRLEAYIFETGERKLILEEGADASYCPTGHLIFVRQGKLYAASFDLERLKVTGEIVPILDDVMQSINARNSNLQTHIGQYVISDSGSLAYITGGPSPDVKRSLVKIDRKGEVQFLTPNDKVYSSPRVSPDGKRLCYYTFGIESDIWIYDFERESHSPLTFNLGTEFARPVWTQDGKWLIFNSRRGNFRIPTDRQVEPELFLAENYMISSISPDGELGACLRPPWPELDIYILDLRDKKYEQFTKTPFTETHPEFSPDGRFIAYCTNETGSFEVYVQPFPGPGKKTQVSKAGGIAPVWNPVGGELFYFNPNDEFMMSVDVTNPLSPKNEQRLFDTTGKNFVFGGGPIRSYDITKDGKYFISAKSDEITPTPVTEIHIIQNWFEELKRLVPTKK
jgi:serine/threonine-protein kinase